MYHGRWEQEQQSKRILGFCKGEWVIVVLILIFALAITFQNWDAIFGYR